MPDKHFFDRQISLTEWLGAADHADTTAHREEDNQKRERLAVLHAIIGLPFDRPVQFPLQAVVDRTPEFVEYFTAHENDLCALRLIPENPNLPKLRMRGQTVGEVVNDWLPEQAADPSQYRADFVPHADSTEWSTIFVINEAGMRGEIIADTHDKLTQGFYHDVTPISFWHDFATNDWRLSTDNEDAEKHLHTLLEHLKTSESQQTEIKSVLNGEFAHGYLQGYFETVDTDQGLWFIDYNRLLPRDIPPLIEKSVDAELRGQVASTGTFAGVVQVVTAPSQTDFPQDGVLVCDMTSPDYLPLMKRAGAIVTERGGITSHAAIVARELGLPCLVGVKDVMAKLKTGDKVRVDAVAGAVNVM